MKNRCYVLAPGTQVREEDFGLLFYTMAGPRLYFLSSGDLLGAAFFSGDRTLREWLSAHFSGTPPKRDRVFGLLRSLHRLQEKGVILER